MVLNQNIYRFQADCPSGIDDNEIALHISKLRDFNQRGGGVIVQKKIGLSCDPKFNHVNVITHHIFYNKIYYKNLTFWTLLKDL